jgi:hypothetical protein
MTLNTFAGFHAAQLHKKSAQTRVRPNFLISRAAFAASYFKSKRSAMLSGTDVCS